MLRVTASQLRALGAAQEEDFVDRSVARLRQEELSGPLLADRDDEALRDAVRASLPRARGLGISSEVDSFHYAKAEVLLGSGFADDPRNRPAAIVLRSRFLSPEDRAEALAFVAESLAETRGEAKGGKGNA